MTSCPWRESDVAVKTAIRCTFSYTLQITSFKKNFHRTMLSRYDLQHSMHRPMYVASFEPG